MSEPKYWVMTDYDGGYKIYGIKKYYFPAVYKNDIFWQGDDYKEALKQLKEATKRKKEAAKKLRNAKKFDGQEMLKI